MVRKARRATAAPRLEPLEARSLLSADAGSVVGPWAIPSTLNASTTLLVRFQSAVNPARVAADLAAVGGRVAGTFPDGPDEIALAPWADAPAALTRLEASADVVYAEADATFHAAGVVVPNDPIYPQDWGLQAIDAPSAWGVTTGTPSTIVAVLDTGLDITNPDFASKLWTNPSATANDGYGGRDVHGWNWVTNSGNILDNNGHGTHVTGILAALGNNATGVAGVDWGAQIMPLKILDQNGNGDTDSAVAAVYYAVQHGAKVINASWGGDVFSQAMLDALNYANAAGVVFVTAAGNESSNNDAVLTYPASYRTPNELVVAAVDQTGALASFSNVGPTTVDLAAPGVGIVSDVPGGVASYDGTSMSTPYVAGTVALLAGLHPGYSAAQLVAQVRATVKPDPALDGLMVSPGIVDPYFALIDHTTLGASGAPTAASTAPHLVSGGTDFEDVEAATLTNDSVYAAFGGTAVGYVRGVYEALFGSDPGAAGAAYYAAPLAAGTMTRADLVRKLQQSYEGELTRVANWYRDDLGSTATLGTLKSDPGVAYWGGLLAAGESDSQVLSALLSNDGYYASVGGTNTAWVAAMYHDVLARGPDAPGLDYFVSELASGTSRSAVVLQLLNSPEGHAISVARLYRDELGSTQTVAALAATSGVNYWSQFLGTD